MVKSCVAFGCSEEQRKGSGIQFHRFPHSRPEMLKKWVQALRWENWSPSIHSCICSKHFTDECYQVRPGVLVRLLKPEAVPTIFNFPAHLQKKVSVRRRLVRSAPVLQVERSEKADSDAQDAEPDNLQQAVQDEEFNQEEVLTFEALRDHLWVGVVLPTPLWGCHRDPAGKYVAFTHVSESTCGSYMSTDKAVLFDGCLEAEVFVRGRRVVPSNLAPSTPTLVRELSILLRNVEALSVCQGTGLDSAQYSPDCCLLLERKYRNSRCSSCSLKRTHLKKTEAQRLRRAAAKQRQPHQLHPTDEEGGGGGGGEEEEEEEEEDYS
ncbi:uncharacterized protein [Periplaneta americana]|uniref:uncharacterized protein isoform X2 n=1 Tax=Periplaneta americana TaxID=6978 RepID=UPI0037E874F2